jgi:acylphosphatase
VPELIRRRVLVTGSVQGVFFRASCRTQAERRRVSGWVRNVADGSVEAVFEGEPEPVESMIEWCRRGPDGASVERIDVRSEAPEGFAGFAITR